MLASVAARRKVPLMSTSRKSREPVALKKETRLSGVSCCVGEAQCRIFVPVCRPREAQRGLLFRRAQLDGYLVGLLSVRSEQKARGAQHILPLEQEQACNFARGPLASSGRPRTPDSGFTCLPF